MPLTAMRLSHVGNALVLDVRTHTLSDPTRRDQAAAKPRHGSEPSSKVSLSHEAQAALAAREATSAARKAGPAAAHELTEEEQKMVTELQARDREVRTHEQAHLAAAGPYANGGPQYVFQTGPDGKRYAVGGHVNIDTSPVPNDPQKTVEKARVIRRAALAPAEPSNQDRRVAAKASAMERKAQAELAELRTEERSGETSPPHVAREDATGADTAATTSERAAPTAESDALVTRVRAAYRAFAAPA